MYDYEAYLGSHEHAMDVRAAKAKHAAPQPATKTSIELHPSGEYFDFANPSADAIHLEDIALGLSQRCRFGAFTNRWYSVASHALLVARLVRDVAGPELVFAALHHDSHEAYIGDVPTPLKPWFGEPYKELAYTIDGVIAERFGIDQELFYHDIVKAADAQALQIEAAVLKKSQGIGAHWPPSHNHVPEIPTGAVTCESPAASRWLFECAHRRALA